MSLVCSLIKYSRCTSTYLFMIGAKIFVFNRYFPLLIHTGYANHLHKAGNKLILAHSIEAPSMPTRESWEQQTQAGQVKSKELKDKYGEKLRAFKIDQFEWEEEVEKPGEFLCGLAKNKSASYVVMGKFN